jgi:hypothetical protein
MRHLINTDHSQHREGEDAKMADVKTLGQRFQEYRASKTTLFWSWVAVAVLTVVVGFNWGGWVTGGTAMGMAQEARRDVAATYCVQRFLAAPDVSAQHASLMETGSWQRDDFVQKGGWAKLPELDRPIAGVAELCAEKLADIEVSEAAAQTTSDGQSTTTVQ